MFQLRKMLKSMVVNLGELLFVFSFCNYAMFVDVFCLQVTIWEALTNSRPVPPSPLYEDDSQLER